MQKMRSPIFNSLNAEVEGQEAFAMPRFPPLLESLDPLMPVPTVCISLKQAICLKTDPIVDQVVKAKTPKDVYQGCASVTVLWEIIYVN